MKKAVLYIRTSEKNKIKNEISIEKQKILCKKIAVERQLYIDKIFIDMDCSAKDLNRPQLQEMFKYCCEDKNKIRAVIISSLDRLTRNLDDLIKKIFPLLKENNIKLYCETVEADLVAVYGSGRELQTNG